MNFKEYFNKKLNEGNKEPELVDPKKVKKGMAGEDYDGNKGKVIAIVKAKDWEKLEEYDSSGWMYDEETLVDEYDIDLKKDYMIAAKVDGTENVWVYGYHGFFVEE